jgi:hypothetical protein
MSDTPTQNQRTILIIDLLAYKEVSVADKVIAPLAKTTEKN